MKKTPLSILIFSVITILFFGAITSPATVRQWEVFDLQMTAKNTYSNPYVDGLREGGKSLVQVTFTGTEGEAQGKRYAMTGFWDGGNNWRVRFAPPYTGTWSYTSISNDPGLNGNSGTIICAGWSVEEKNQNPVRRGFVRVCKTGNRPGRYFEYADGTPFLWIGDTWWNWTKRGIYFSSFKKMADDRAAKGFSVGQLFLAGNGWGRISSLLDPTWNILDTAHMQKVDSMIVYANSKGITVWIHGWWSRKDIDKTIGTEKMRRYWRYLVNRFAAYNVIWIMAGEYNMNNYGGLGLQFWKDLGKLIKSEDPYDRIVSAHPTPPAWSGGAEAPQWSTGDVMHSESWLDYNQSQVGHGKWRNEMIPAVISENYARVPSKPIVVTEPWYEFIKGNPSAEEIRFGGWSAILSGAAGHSYGGGHVWKAHVPEAPGGKDNWPMEMGFESNTLDYPGALQIGYLSSFLRDISWWELEPHQDLLLEYSGGYCAAVPGKEYVIYVRWGGSVKVNLNPSTTNDIFEYLWFDPSTGKNLRAGTVSGGSNQTFNAPSDYPSAQNYRDMVLHIIKK